MLNSYITTCIWWTLSLMSHILGGEELHPLRHLVAEAQKIVIGKDGRVADGQVQSAASWTRQQGETTKCEKKRRWGASHEWSHCLVVGGTPAVLWLHGFFTHKYRGVPTLQAAGRWVLVGFTSHCTTNLFPHCFLCPVCWLIHVWVQLQHWETHDCQCRHKRGSNLVPDRCPAGRETRTERAGCLRTWWCLSVPAWARRPRARLYSCPCILHRSRFRKTHSWKDTWSVRTHKSET